MFNDYEKDFMHAALEYKFGKSIPIAVIPFYDHEEVYFAVELYTMMSAIYKTRKHYKLESKLHMMPIIRLITFWVTGL